MKISWVKWDDVCRPEYYGGLRFKYVRIFNKVLLAINGGGGWSHRVVRGFFFLFLKLGNGERTSFWSNR